jgi:hypothetical protein
VVVDRIIEGPSDTIVGEDSVKIDNDRIWIEAFGLGKITLNYKVKDVIIHDTTEVTSVVIPPTRQQERTKRVEARQKGKTDRVQIKYKYKTIKVTEQKNDLLYIGIAIGLAISYLAYRLYKRFFS